MSKSSCKRISWIIAPTWIPCACLWRIISPSTKRAIKTTDSVCRYDNSSSYCWTVLSIIGPRASFDTCSISCLISIERRRAFILTTIGSNITKKTRILSTTKDTKRYRRNIESKLRIRTGFYTHPSIVSAISIIHTIICTTCCTNTIWVIRISPCRIGTIINTLIILTKCSCWGRGTSKYTLIIKLCVSKIISSTSWNTISINSITPFLSYWIIDWTCFHTYFS